MKRSLFSLLALLVCQLYAVAPVMAQVYWVGINSQQWDDPNNWSPVGIPTSADEVHIGGTAYSNPVVNGTFDVGDLYIETGAHIKHTGQLNVYGDIYGVSNLSDDLYEPGLTVMMKKNGTITTDNPLTFGNLELQADTYYDGQIQVFQKLNLANGSLLQAGAEPLVLLSGPDFSTGYDNQGMVVNQNGNVVSGDVIAQRYIDTLVYSGVGYRHYSTPMVASHTDQLAISGGVFSPTLTTSYNSATFNPTTHTRPASPFPNVFYYDETRVNTTSPDANDFVSGYQVPDPTAATNMFPGYGYSVYISAAATVALPGALNDGDIAVTGLGRGAFSNSGWHLLGNPYPSPIDWDFVTIPPDFDASIYVNRPTGTATLGSTYGYYDVYVNGVSTTCSGSTTGTCEPDQLLPMMQGFFIRHNGSTSGTGTFTFHNSDRVTSYANPSFYRGTARHPAVSQPLARFWVTDATTRKGVSTVVHFPQEATSGHDRLFDAVRLPHEEPGFPVMYTLAGREECVINGLPALQALESVPVELRNLTVGQRYTITATDLENFAPGTRVLLEDKLMGVWQDLTATAAYSFFATSAAADNRFRLHFDPTGKMSPVAATAGLVADVFPTQVTAGESVQCLVTAATGTTRAELFDTYGNRLAVRELAPSESTRFATAGLARGVYSLRLSAGGGVVTRRLVVQ